MKEKHTKTKPVLSIIVLCVVCIALSGYGIYTNWKEPTPKQDKDGYYLLRTKEDFRWFVSMANDTDSGINVRLANDLVLNDTDGWEDWVDTHPESGYAPVIRYSGHFDGNGYALEGYYARYKKWLAAIFTTLEEDALITDLHVRNSIFHTTYEDSCYTNDNEKTDIAIATALCYANYGKIERCDLEVNVSGAWSAGGMVAENYGQITDCRFAGIVEAGLDQGTEMPENGLYPDTLYAGSICSYNDGAIINCTNEAAVTLHSLSDEHRIYTYAAGGIAGRVTRTGTIENCQNAGNVESVQLAGGIAGGSWGTIKGCTNSGNVHVEQVEREFTESLICAGICASNGGMADTCINTGLVTINQKYLSFYAPIYGIACNTINPSDGVTRNCYYLKESAKQAYRQSGVYKLSSADSADLPAYLAGDKRLEDTDTWELLTSLPDYPGTDKDDFIHLGFGPAEDFTYEAQPGDTLWDIADKFYGQGRLYGLLERCVKPESILSEDALTPGEQIRIPHKDYYLLCPNDEEGFTWSYSRLPSGESCPTRYAAAKPINWYYGNMYFAANIGLDTMWPKDKEAGQDAAAADIRIFYRLDHNPDGDFFSEDWNAVQESIRKSASIYCQDAIDSLLFYRYTLDNGENLYGYSFRLHKPSGTLKCAVFYQLGEGMLTEFIGVEPVTEEEHVLERVRYLAARVDTTLEIDESQYNPEEFYGKENWAFPQLHNPFAVALEYSKDAKCSSYMLFTGAQ